MSRDIRTFFQPAGKKSNQTNIPSQKKRPLALDSSDEDIVGSTPHKELKKERNVVKRKKINTISSDSEDEASIKKQKAPKTVNVADIFGSAPVKQSKIEINKPEKDDETKGVSKKPNKGKSTKKTIPKSEEHGDPDFEKSLLELDEDLLLENADFLDKTIEEALQADTKQERNQSARKRQNESKIDDQERYERKRYCAMQYQKYLNRSGPVHHGVKEYPKGKPDCLKNICFLRTGVLDSLENNEFEDLVKNHGGRTVQAVSKKVNYVVAGEDAGPAKLAKAMDYKIPTISEDEFLDLIVTKSGMKAKYALSKDSNSEDLCDNNEDCSESSEVKKKLAQAKSSPPIDKVDSEAKESATIKKEMKTPSKSQKKEEIFLPKVLQKKEEGSSKVTIPCVSIKEEDDVVISSGNMMTWTEKYKPSNTKNIIGQQGDKSNMNKLTTWLQNWPKHHSSKTKTKLIKPSPWAKNDDGAFFKCTLLSGPPGVGKTTTATLVAKELGYDIVEFNASDTRSKKLLHDEVSQLLSTTSLAGFCNEGSAPTKRRVLLMDEVDGMAGNEDRGGMQELIILIKNSSIPIICMCNDRNHLKVRSLANYCFDLRFSKPRLEQIRGTMMSICFKENLKITATALSEIIIGAGMDIRQTLNHLSLWTVDNKSLTADVAGNEAKAAKKDTVMGPWDVIKKVFSEEEHKSMTLADKSRLFFFDYSIGPLFVQENYLQVVPHCPKNQVLDKIANTADSISMGDLVDKKIRSGNNWSLLEVQAVYASVLPGHYLEGHFGGQINFPGWLGKNSKRGKFQRLLSELQAHMRTNISGSNTAVNLDYVYHIQNRVVTPLVKERNEGVQEAVEVMNSYNLLREDLDSLIELTQWPGQKDPLAMVDSKVKAAFTRAYHKGVVKLPYSTSSTYKKKTGTASLDEEDIYREDNGELSGEEDEDISKDNMIAAKKPSKQPEKKNITAGKKPVKGRGRKK